MNLSNYDFLIKYKIISNKFNLEDSINYTLNTLKINTDFEFTKDNLYCCFLEELGYKKELSIDKINKLGLYYFESELDINKFNLLLESFLKAKINDSPNKYIEKMCYDGYFDSFVEENPHHVIYDGETLPVFKVDENFFEKVYIEVPLDTDDDGMRDLVEVYIKRPRHSPTNFKVPVIYISSPYSRGTVDDLYKTHNVDFDLTNFDKTDVSYEEIKYEYLEKPLPQERKIISYGEANIVEDVELENLTPFYDYFLSRGYAIVVCGGVGTRGSQGIRSYGSIEDTISTISVIDWLNDRINAFTDKNSNIAVKASWCSGNVGMTGKSYLGTLAVAASTTGIDGLKTVVPEAAISNWYNYYRQNGLCVPALDWQGDDGDLLAEHCMSRYFDEEDYKSVEKLFESHMSQMKKLQSREYGNYNKFYDEKNYLNNVSNVCCSVFIVHGLNDYNVKPGQAINYYNKLSKYNKNVKMLLHRGEHIYIDNIIEFDYASLMNRWYGHYLLDIKNDVNQLPNVYIQSNLNPRLFETGESFPFDNIKENRLYCDENKHLTYDKPNVSTSVSYVDDLEATGFIRTENNYKIWHDNIVQENAKNQDQRILLLSEVLETNTRFSGVATLKMRIKSSEDVGIVSCMVVDYGKVERMSKSLIEKSSEYYTYGYNSSKTKLMEFCFDDNKTDYNIVTRAHMSMQNRRDSFNKDELVADKFYEITLNLEANDYIFAKGNKIGVMIYATDPEQTNRGFKKIKYTVDLSSVELILPLDKTI